MLTRHVVGAFIPLRKLTQREREWMNANRRHDITRQIVLVANALEYNPHLPHARREWNHVIDTWRQTRKQEDYGTIKPQWRRK